jgi:hypothetical protein
MAEPIRVAEGPDGTLGYALPFPPEALPAVSGAALSRAWAAARAGAAQAIAAPARRIAFRGSPPVILEIADRDARIWAEAVDRDAGLETRAGMAACLRLLALIDLLARSRALDHLLELDPRGAELHPRLLAAAARWPLDRAGRFDAAQAAAMLRDPPGVLA